MITPHQKAGLAAKHKSELSKWRPGYFNRIWTMDQGLAELDRILRRAKKCGKHS